MKVTIPFWLCIGVPLVLLGCDSKALQTALPTHQEQGAVASPPYRSTSGKRASKRPFLRAQSPQSRQTLSTRSAPSIRPARTTSKHRRTHPSRFFPQTPIVGGIRKTTSKRHWPPPSHLCQGWQKRLSSGHFLLSKEHHQKLIRASNGNEQPTPNAQQQALIQRYKALQSELTKIRACYRREYQRARSSRARKRLLNEAQSTIVALLNDVTLPLWIGTPWDYYGTSEAPHQKSIACGYFLVHALLSVGFQLPDNRIYHSRHRGKMRLFRLAQFTATGIARRLSHRSLTQTFRNQPMKAMWKPLRKQGPGVYVLGLDQHVGLVLYDGKNAYFWHSNYASPKAWVKREDLFSSNVVHNSNVRMLAKLSLHTYRKWLSQQPIRARWSATR